MHSKINYVSDKVCDLYKELHSEEPDSGRIDRLEKFLRKGPSEVLVRVKSDFLITADKFKNRSEGNKVDIERARIYYDLARLADKYIKR